MLKIYICEDIEAQRDQIQHMIENIALGADMTGLTLAQKIRKYDPRGFIIFGEQG